MAKVVITRNRDIVGVPTEFLTASGEGKSVSNKDEFKAIAEEVKMEHDLGKIDKLLGKVIQGSTIRINPEFTIDEGYEGSGI